MQSPSDGYLNHPVAVARAGRAAVLLDRQRPGVAAVAAPRYLHDDGRPTDADVLPIGEAATALTGLAGRVGSDTLVQLTGLAGEVATGVDPVGCAVFIGSSAIAGVIQDRAVDAASLADMKRADLVERYRDDPDWKGMVSLWALTKIGKLLPDGEAWNEAVVESATGDHDRLLGLLQTYRDEPAKREAWEQTVEAAQAEFEQSLEINRRVGNRREEARSLRGLADVADERGDERQAADRRAEAEQISATIGDEHAPDGDDDHNETAEEESPGSTSDE